MWARRFRDLLALHINDLGGPDNVSEGERAIVRRAATLMVELERMETEFAGDNGGTLETLELYQRCANTMSRLLRSVGLKRRAKDVTPTLSQYLESRAQREAAE
jgi:hypothetical protein